MSSTQLSHLCLLPCLGVPCFIPYHPNTTSSDKGTHVPVILCPPRKELGDPINVQSPRQHRSGAGRTQVETSKEHQRCFQELKSLSPTGEVGEWGVRPKRGQPAPLTPVRGWQPHIPREHRREQRIYGSSNN